MLSLYSISIGYVELLFSVTSFQSATFESSPLDLVTSKRPLFPADMQVNDCNSSFLSTMWTQKCKSSVYSFNFIMDHLYK